MNFPGLRMGNNLPAVGVLQHLLVRGGKDVGIDGDFGSGTQGALEKYQETNGLWKRGHTDPFTWEHLTYGKSFPILDVVDIFDENLYEMEATDIKGILGKRIVVDGMDNGVEYAVTKILSAVKNPLFLLRFHGHGAPGEAGVADGKGADFDHSAFTTRDMDHIRPLLMKLRGIFGPYGCVQFMHCSTGRGRKGIRLLKAIADELKVPVSAALRTQKGGKAKTFFYEGATHTQIPDGKTIGSWTRSLPRMPFSPTYYFFP